MRARTAVVAAAEADVREVLLLVLLPSGQVSVRVEDVRVREHGLEAHGDGRRSEHRVALRDNVLPDGLVVTQPRHDTTTTTTQRGP
jgi:hypothetical protein